MLLSRLLGFGASEPSKPPIPKHTIPTYAVHNKEYSNIFSNIDSDSDSDSVDGSSVLPYVRPDKTTSSSKTKSYQQLSVKSAAFRAKLQRASRNVPKYLFRMWYEGSGGDARLNSVSAVTPHAFLYKKGHKSVYDMTYDEFTSNAEAHVEGDTDVLSEFSSWSQSPHFAFNYAMNIRNSLENSKSIHIAVMDTEVLAQSNPAFNVAVLHETFPNDFEPIYHEEYLVHGIVQGPFYKAVPFHRLCAAGLLKYLPSITKSICPLSAGGLTRLLPRETKHFKIEDLSKLMDLAHLYGANFTVPVAVTLFCCRKHPKLWSTLTPLQLQRMVELLGGRNKVLEVWGKSQSVIYDGTYPKGYEANKQMIRVMRALTHFCWEQEAGHNAVNDHLASKSPVTAIDEDQITSRMSSVHVSPAPSKNFAAAPPSDGPQQSRKRPRAESVSPYYAYNAPLSKVPNAWPILLSKVKSPYARDTGGDHMSSLKGASFAVRSLWAQIRMSDPKLLSFYIKTDKIAMISINDDITLHFQSLPTDNIESTKIGPVDFAYSKDGGILWFARIPPGLSLKINGERLGTQYHTIVGPLPSFSVWESEKGVAFVYTEMSATEYEAKGDHDHDDGRAAKRQRR